MKKLIALLLLLSICGCQSAPIKENATSEKTSVQNTVLTGTFIEESDPVEYATTITLKDDQTFETTLNMCKAMVDLTGTYTVDGDKVYLTFPESTGFNFIDENQPYIFILSDNRLVLSEDSQVFSCAYVDTYLKQ